VNQISSDFDCQKTATDIVSLVPLRKGVDFYRTSNSRVRTAVDGAVYKYIEDEAYNVPYKNVTKWTFMFFYLNQYLI
jgi:glutathione peroxidase-family protein